MEYIDIEFFNSGVKASKDYVVKRFLDDISEACNDFFGDECFVTTHNSIFTGTVRGITIYFPLTKVEERTEK